MNNTLFGSYLSAILLVVSIVFTTFVSKRLVDTIQLSTISRITNVLLRKKTMLLIESEGIIERVRYMMESMELNATAFATEAGITPSVISHMLNGRNRPTIETLNNIISAYPSWSYEWLLFGKGTPKREEQSVSLPIESSLFGSYEASAPSSQTAHATPSSESTLQSGLTSIPFTSEEVEQIRQVLLQQHTATREVSEIRIFYSDGSYEIFVPQSSAK